MLRKIFRYTLRLVSIFHTFHCFWIQLILCYVNLHRKKIPTVTISPRKKITWHEKKNYIRETKIIMAMHSGAGSNGKTTISWIKDCLTQCCVIYDHRMKYESAKCTLFESKGRYMWIISTVHVNWDTFPPNWVDRRGAKRARDLFIRTTFFSLFFSLSLSPECWSHLWV